MKILFYSAASALGIKKIMFQCQVYKQHPCSIMFKEIIPTQGCSSLLNKSLSRICVLTFLFLGTLCSFLLSSVRSINRSTNPVTLNKVKIMLVPVVQLSLPYASHCSCQKNCVLLEIPLKIFFICHSSVCFFRLDAMHVLH